MLSFLSKKTVAAAFFFCYTNNRLLCMKESTSLDLNVFFRVNTTYKAGLRSFMLCGCPQYSECAPGDSQLHQNKQNQLQTAHLPLLCSRVRPRLAELKFLCVCKYVPV